MTVGSAYKQTKAARTALLTNKPNPINLYHDPHNLTHHSPLNITYPRHVISVDHQRAKQPRAARTEPLSTDHPGAVVYPLSQTNLSPQSAIIRDNY